MTMSQVGGEVRGGSCDQVPCPCPGGRGVGVVTMSQGGGGGCCDHVPGGGRGVL